MLPSLKQLGTQARGAVGRRTAAAPRMGADRTVAEVAGSRGVAADFGFVSRQACAPGSRVIRDRDGFARWHGSRDLRGNSRFGRLRQGVRGYPSGRGPRRCRRACALLCSARTTGSCRRLSSWRKTSARARFPFSRSTSPTRTHLAAWTITPTISHCARRIWRYSSSFWTRWSGSHAEEFRSGFIAESPQKLRRILQYFAAVHGTRSLSFGSLQRAGVFRGDRRHRPRATLFLHLRAAGRAGVRRGRAIRQRSRELLEQRRDDGAARGDSQRRPRRMQDLRLFDVAGS